MLSLKASPAKSELESAIAQLGATLWQGMRGEVPGIFNADFWQGKLLEWAMKDAAFRVDLFRFVDVLPALKDRKQVFAHLKDYLLREDRELPLVLAATLKAASGGLTGVVAVEVIKRNLVKMAENFIVGENPKQALGVLKKLHQQGIGFTADLLGEATLTATEGEEYLQRYGDLIATLAKETADWREDKVLTRSHLGSMPLVNVSLKLSALDGRLDPINGPAAAERLAARLRPLFLMARQKNVALNVDMESWAGHALTYDCFEALALDPALRDWPFLGIVVQAYLHRAPEDLLRLEKLAERRGAPLAVRLVKGAYWDYESALAQQRGYPCPVLIGKNAVDAQYERLSRDLLDRVDRLQPAFGSHNLRSLVHALAYAECRGIPREAYEVQMLYGMAEPERKALRDRGHRVRVYAPVGALLPGMAYLVRRLLENTSNTGFLRQTYHEHTRVETLLASPEAVPESEAGKTALNREKPPFRNCDLLDFADPEVRERFARAVAEARRPASAAAPVIPLVIGGQRITRPGDFAWFSPNDVKYVVSKITMATIEESERAVASAAEAYPAWEAKPWRERAQLLERLADELQRKRLALAALQVIEVAKPWAEADADVAEAIDFCRYYAQRAAAELAEESLDSPTGEANVLRWQGRGVCAVIAPWNFPLAIVTGMAAAALVAGNAVILKPAEQSSATAYALFEAMQAAGFPENAAQFLPGRGEVTGSFLVRHPEVTQIAFTGSFAVGTGILAEAAQMRAGQRMLKRVVCELGGKNAIIVDDDADLDEAVAGVAKSAFGYAGQKCSAASRLFLVGDIYEAFVTRLAGHLDLWTVSPAWDSGCDLPPVIDDDSAARLREAVRAPGSGTKALYLGRAPEGGRFVAPAVFAVDSTRHRFMQEEFFGPVLAVLRAESFSQALDWVKATPYALTGAVYSRRPSHIDLAREHFRVGNLYVNRPCTGAMVGRQPFGGFGHSGLGSKAGGPGYLRLFADARAISESTMRHGFTPDS